MVRLLKILATSILLLALTVFAVVGTAILALGAFVDEPSVAAQEATESCNFLTEVTVRFRGAAYRLPAKQGIRIRSASSQAHIHLPDIIPKRDGGRILGICDAEFENKTEILRVEFHGPKVPDIARDLGLHSHETIRRLSFGVLGTNSWLRHSSLPLDEQNPEILRYREDPQDALTWQFAETSGHLANGFRVASWCSEYRSRRVPNINCNMRMTHQDGRVYELWGFKQPNLPEIGAPLPQSFIEMTERVPKIETLFSTPSE